MPTRRCATTILGLLLASGCCEEGLTKAHEIAIEPHGALRAITAGKAAYGYEYYLVDAGGYLSILGEVRQRRGYELEVIDEVQVSSSPLVDIFGAYSYLSGGSLWVVDDAGGVFESKDGGQTWTNHPLDAGLEPRGILSSRSGGWSGDHLIVYGDGFVRVRSLEGGEWLEPEVPEGGWGSLRAATAGPSETLISDGTSLLVTFDPPTHWQRADAPIEVLTIGARPFSGWEFEYILGGPRGLLMRAIVGEVDPWTDVTWTSIDEDIDADVIVIEDRWVLTSAGQLVDLDSDEVFDVGDARAGLAVTSAEVLVFGANGPVLSTEWMDCDEY